MKVNVEIDLSPQEARELMGWPDIGKFHEKLMEALGDQMQEAGSDNMAAFMEPFLAESQRAFSSYQKLMENMINLGNNKK